MSRFFAHSEHAKDQPLRSNVLVHHATYRGYQAGAILGHLLCWAHAVPIVLSRATPHTQLFPKLYFFFECGMGAGAVVGSIAMAIGLQISMWGRDEREWRDRCWRLLENKSQMKLDDWSLAGAAGALTAAVMREAWRNKPFEAYRVPGVFAIGSLVGVGAYGEYYNGYGNKGEE